jgi:hypothetical protein
MLSVGIAFGIACCQDILTIHLAAIAIEPYFIPALQAFSCIKIET